MDRPWMKAIAKEGFSSVEVSVIVVIGLYAFVLWGRTVNWFMRLHRTFNLCLQGGHWHASLGGRRIRQVTRGDSLASNGLSKSHGLLFTC